MHPVLLIVTAALTACLYLVGLALDLFWLKLLTKPWLVLALAAAVWSRAGAGAGRRIAWGLVAGAVGDVCLALPHAFLPGMIAFAIGHGLYVAPSCNGTARARRCCSRPWPSTQARGCG